MTQFLIKTDDPTIKQAVLNLLVTLSTIGGDKFEFEQTDAREYAKGNRKSTAGMARIHYVPKLPTDNIERLATIKANLATLGEHKVIGLMYARIIAKQDAGQIITEPQLRKDMDLKAGTSQREIGTLCRIGLVESMPIIHDEVVDTTVPEVNDVID